MLQILKYYKFLFGVSGLLLVVGIIFLSVYGLKVGIDFKGGTVSELKFEQTVDTAKVEQALLEAGVKHPTIQTTGTNGLIIKTEALDKEIHDKATELIRSKVGNFEEVRFESIGPTIGKELTKNAVYQLILVSLAIILYISYVFRRVPRPITSWRFGVAAIVALLHDLIVVLGVFAFIGHFWGIEVDSMFVTALLTVLGFSVHDTIVVFDRIRENLKQHGGSNLTWIVNHSITQTIVRSLNTSLSVLLVLLAMLLFGGETIRYFVLALFIGIVTGTYSSIFVASPIIVLWHSWRKK